VTRSRNDLISLTISLLSLCLFAGCSGSDSTDDPASAGNSSPEAPKTETVENSKPVNPVQVDPGGRKMLVDIPYDVWFPDPLGVVQEQGTVVANTTPDAKTEPGTKEPPTTAVEPEPKSEPAAQGVVWGEVIPMSILDAEIKEDRNFLTTALQSVGKFNSSVKDIPPRAMTIAALAQIALTHQEQVLWKDRAAAMRDVAVNLANAADGTGRAPFAASTEQFEKIQEIFNGTTPELKEPPEPNLPFADKADRGPLMRRINIAFEWLNANTPTAAAVEKAKEKTVHETVILTTLIKVISDKSYYQADEPDYIKHVEEITDALTKMEKGLETNNFDSFKESLGVVNKKCTECHLGYKDKN
jgi:hypothetical protein